MEPYVEYPYRHEIDTRLPDCSDRFEIEGIRLTGLPSVPLVLRHEKYQETEDRLSLFDMDLAARADGSQVLLLCYRLPADRDGFQRELELFTGQKKGFRFADGSKFDERFLALQSAPEGIEHTAFQTRDGRARRRVVHVYQSPANGAILVYSANSADFQSNLFFAWVASHLTIG